MKYWKTILAAVLLAGGIAWIGWSNNKAMDAVPWRTDLAAARAEAARLHKPVFIDFTASWCGPCQQMARETWSDPAVASALKNMVPVRIDLDQHPDVAGQYHVQSIPAFFVVDADGNVTNSGGGFMPPSRFLAWLNEKPK